LSDGDADAQYKAGYDAIVRGDYAFAEEQFRQFVALYPKDRQAADATNWLGEALLQRGAYDEAADALLTGFQAYQGSPRAPDLLLKLGIALAGAGEQDTACRTFFEVAKRYPDQPAAFVQRLNDEKAKAQCPV
jgi:tol-pal system protein YbgF